jgi:hypothetical protein
MSNHPPENNDPTGLLSCLKAPARDTAPNHRAVAIIGAIAFAAAISFWIYHFSS